jgi:hypothetical protein
MRHPTSLIVIGAVLALTGCVGAARTTSTYEGKATRTANDALSQVQTARLTVQASLRGKMLQTYMETVLSDAEDSVSSIQAAFGSIQPPDTARADQLRDELSKVLSDAEDALSQLRIDARRQHSDKLAGDVAALEPIAGKLETFGQANG